MGVAKMLHMPIKWRRHHTFVANYAMYKISYIFGTAVPRFSAVICTRTDTVQYTFTVTCSFFLGGGEIFHHTACNGVFVSGSHHGFLPPSCLVSCSVGYSSGLCTFMHLCKLKAYTLMERLKMQDWK